MAITFTTLASFDGTDGQTPEGELVVDGNGNLYGTSSGRSSSGTPGEGNVFELPGSTGPITVLHSFSDSGGDGFNPFGSLTMDASGVLYGTTANGGSGGAGTVFAPAPDGGSYLYGQVANVYTGGSDGSIPATGVYDYVAPDGTNTIIGTTARGGANSTGTVFTLERPSSTPAFTSFPAANPSSSSIPSVGPFTPRAPNRG